MFIEDQGLSWQDPWIQSLDLEYHNVHPERGLFFALKPAKTIGEFNRLGPAPGNQVHRSQQYSGCRPLPCRGSVPEKESPLHHHWDSIALESQDYLSMPDPFKTYTDAVDIFLK